MRELDAPPATWHTANDHAFAVVAGGDLLLTTRRLVHAWAELSAAERIDVLGLIDGLATDAAVRFDLRAPAGGRWHVRVSPAPAPFAGLPGFVAGEEQHLLPVLRAGLAAADEAELLSAFLQGSGVELLRLDLEDALRRGARIRVLTGDYLGITAPAALRALCELTEAHPRLEAAIYQCGAGETFHAKAYVFVREGGAIAYVGSANLSRPALTGGVEWSLRALTGESTEVPAIRARFDRLWRAPATVRLTRAWIDAYAASRPAIHAAWDPPGPRPVPHAIQREALEALEVAWAAGARRGLVVLATGLGKTLLAAFAAEAMAATRVLFVAHRDEILSQARGAFARVLPGRTSGFFSGQGRDKDAELVFASVQTLSRDKHLSKCSKGHFDMIIVDEFHHAAAATYRRIIDHFAPRFLLGLTATPERSDGGELLALCEDRLIFRADILRGIECGRLVPFAYHGLKDSVDYQAIPWRNGRFDDEALCRALATQEHAAQALAGYQAHAPAGTRRGLWFCASIAHAEFMARFLQASGIAAVAVHSGPSGAARSESLRRLATGELEAIATVDVFNEGVDVPDVNVVVLLRPTDSRVVFLQQIGRGLRLPERSHKPRLVILDFIGNHRAFLRRPQALAGLLGRDLPARAAVRGLREGMLALPEGCSVTIETEVIDLLMRLSGGEEGGDAILYALRERQDDLGRRPTLAELIEVGVLIRDVTAAFGSWWDLLARCEELSVDEAPVHERHRRDLHALERSRVRDPDAWAALRAWVRVGVDADAPIAASTRALIAALWPGAVTEEGGALRLSDTPASADLGVFEAMVDEIAAAREIEAGQVLVRVASAGPRAILFYDEPPPEAGSEQIVDALGERYVFTFASQAINVAVREPGGPNQLSLLLRRIFGTSAGDRGQGHAAALRRGKGSWTLVPILSQGAPVVALPYYAELAVACGVGDITHADADAAATITVRTNHPVDPARHFVVRARGSSMDGGARPIVDGALVLCERLAASTPEEVEGRVCLLTATHGPDASEALLKEIARGGDGWVLRSWSKGQADRTISEASGLRVVARMIEVVPAI